MIKSCHPHSLTTRRCDCYSHVTDKGAEARRRRRGLFIPGPASPSGQLTVPTPSCLSLPESLPVSPLLLSLTFCSPHSPAEACLASLFAGRILPKPQRGDGFCRPRMRGVLVSPHASRPGCSWHLEGEGVGGRACIPLLGGRPAVLPGGAPRLVDPPNPVSPQI